MSNSKYVEPHYHNGKRTQAGKDAENARRKAARRPTRRLPGSAVPLESKADEQVSLEEFVFAVPVVSRYTEHEVWNWIDYYRTRTNREPVFTRSDIERIKACALVPTEKLRQEFIKRQDDPEFYALFIDEMIQARKIKGEFGPNQTQPRRLAVYLKQRLGVNCVGTSVRLLIDYRLAEVLCKSLGLRPVDVGV